MRDAELPLVIVRYDEDTDQGIKDYKQNMYAYSSKSAQMSVDNLESIFSDDAAVRLKGTVRCTS